jgi:hypothetical protein
VLNTFLFVFFGFFGFFGFLDVIYLNTFPDRVTTIPKPLNPKPKPKPNPKPNPELNPNPIRKEGIKIGVS